MGEATDLLKRWQTGDDSARDALIELVYGDLRTLAGRIMRSAVGNVELQPTELVNESFLRLFGLDRIQWQDRAHFLAVAATTMRQVLVDHYRKLNAAKRERKDINLTMDRLPALGINPSIELVDDALIRLAEVSPSLVQVVEMKFFGGMTNPEIAHALDVSESTVKRNWRAARAWLLDDLRSPPKTGRR